MNAWQWIVETLRAHPRTCAVARKSHPAIRFGVCAGVRTTTALGMVQDAAKSKVPALDYGTPHAIGNTLLTVFGIVTVLLLG